MMKPAANASQAKMKAELASRPEKNCLAINISKKIAGVSKF